MLTAARTGRASLVALALGALLGACARAGEGDATSEGDASMSPTITLDSGSPFHSTGSSDAADFGLDDATSGEDALSDDDAGDGGLSSVGPEDDAGDGGITPRTCAATCMSGCCDSDGVCFEGTSDTACGASAGNCSDCTLTSGTCRSRACVASGVPDAGAPPPPPVDASAPPPPRDAGVTPPPPVDAGSPPPPVDAGSSPPPPVDAGGTCNPAACTNLCVPYFVTCCKADNTCGCSLFFPPGPCN